MNNIILGDCVKEIPKLDNSVHLLLSDIPYGIGAEEVVCSNLQTAKRKPNIKPESSNPRRVLMSIRAEWIPLIFGTKRKTVELRKIAPNIPTPYDVEVYESGPLGCHKVVGRFTVTEDERFYPHDELAVGSTQIRAQACVKFAYAHKYFEGYEIGHALYIYAPKLYDTSKELSDFFYPCIDPYEYCPCCKHGLETMSEDEAEFYRLGESANTEWICFNRVRRAPQNFCYISCREEE